MRPIQKNEVCAEIRRTAVVKAGEGRCLLLDLPLDHSGGESENADRLAPKLFTRDWRAVR
jgi:hypothetical protein